MATCLIMINVTIFALPMSSTYIAFSGLTGVTMTAFGFNPENKNLMVISWLIGEMLIWIFSPLVSMGLAYLM